MYRIEINDDDITAGLARLSTSLSDMTPVMNQVGEILEDGVYERWQRGVAPDGSSWAPKSQTTIDAYLSRGLRADTRPLFGPNESGVPLRQSIFRQYGADYVEIGTNAIQAAVMQFGASKGAFGQTSRGAPIPWGNIPARPYLGVSEEDRIKVLAELTDWFNDVTAA